jgi:hypothetical protein
LIDLERGWNLEHEDLPPGIPLLNGVIREKSVYHGTAVLGIIVGIHDNGKGIAGIAPKASVQVISDNFLGLGEEPHYTIEASLIETAANIDLAISHLGFGDVLLLETTRGGRPVEIVGVIRERIIEATRRGIIVVEAAGNEGLNLDEEVDELGQHVLNRLNPGEFIDSGAILVAASNAEHPHVRWHDQFGDTNFGSRVDCYAWGEGIVTTGSVSRPRKKDAYYKGGAILDADNFFGGTSGASAIIAGVCLLVQSLQTNPALVPTSGTTGKLGADAMRRMLRKRANGSESLFFEDRIGVMPDFNKILGNEYSPIPILGGSPTPSDPSDPTSDTYS